MILSNASRTRLLIRAAASLGALAALAVAAVILGPRLFGLQSFVVVQGSMAPTIPAGAVVITEPVAADAITVGDIITFARSDGSYVTHRVVRLESDLAKTSWFVTKGDANGVEDSTRVQARGTGWRVVREIPAIGYLAAAAGHAYARLAFLIVGVLIAIHLLIDAARELVSARKERAPAAS